MLRNTSKKLSKNSNEKGASLVIALLVMTLLLGFAALALSRSVTETAVSTNDEAESRTYSAAEAALEDATRDFATIITNKFVPQSSDITAIETSDVPYFQTNGYTFIKKITQLSAAKNVTQTKGQFQGLISLRDEWQIDVTAKDTATGVETQVRRRFYNDRIPIFQFGAFYQDDMELWSPGGVFLFNGRVHTNGNMFLNTLQNNSNYDIRFKSKVTIGGELVRNRIKTGAALASSEQGDNVYAQNTTNADTQIPYSKGSVTCGSTLGGGVLKDNSGRNFPYPNCSANSTWSSFSQNFEGNVVTKARQLTLPINPLVDIIKRSRNIGDKDNINGTLTTITSANEDNGIKSHERYANHEGIRISLADSKDKLPQCANVAGACGVQLDKALGASLGYQPLMMLSGYKATALNGNRLAVSGRQVWIKVELVSFDYDNEKPITKDVTEDILSLGVTEPIIDASTPTNLKVAGYTTATDSRSIIKLQHFAVEGSAIPNVNSSPTYVSSQSINPNSYNFVIRYKNIAASCTTVTCMAGNTIDDVFAAPLGSSVVSNNETEHLKLATFDNWGSRVAIVPFPIELFDTREGNRYDNTTDLTNKYVYTNGVMSVIDIDVANLRKFLSGTWDGDFPVTTPFALSNGNVGLKSTNVPQNRGWVVYVSDRRGDYDFDGKYKMEDVNPNSNSLLDEDIDNDGTIDIDTTNEAAVQDSESEAGMSAVTDHRYFRRSTRLINGSTLPGIYDTTTTANTRGFTFASENGIYVQGNYNATSATIASGSNVTTSNAYLPYNSSLHIPASVAGDGVTVLSNNWNDGQSFAFPNSPDNRPATNTLMRFAMITGDSLTASVPNPSVSFEGYNGGLNNLIRFMESWSGDRMNYSGSMINLFNSYNSNGRFKCCTTVYKAPNRDWTFEDSYTDPSRLPPATPFVYFISFTGFERVND
jgi:Tfp pilus assembly protein PilX